MALQVVAPDDSRLSWHGHISLQHTADWVMPWRIPYREQALFPPAAFAASDRQSRAAMPAGVRLAFHSDTTVVAGRIVAQPEASPLDLACDGQVYGSVALTGQEQFRFADLPPGEKLIELWLPQHGEFRLRSLELSAGASLIPYADPRPRWVTYGSSITHCRTAARPTETWPALVARASDLNLTCLGYGGNCHLEPMVARMIRDRPADLLSMKVGINVHNHGSLNARTFRPAIIGFVRIVRERHPDVPFAVVSPIYAAWRETQPNEVGFTIAAMREEVAAAVAALQAHGDRHLHYADGLEIFGPQHAHLLPDDLHPSAEGYQVLAQNFLRVVMPQLLSPSQADS